MNSHNERLPRREFRKDAARGTAALAASAGMASAAVPLIVRAGEAAPPSMRISASAKPRART